MEGEQSNMKEFCSLGDHKDEEMEVWVREGKEMQV